MPFGHLPGNAMRALTLCIGPRWKGTSYADAQQCNTTASCPENVVPFYSALRGLNFQNIRGKGFCCIELAAFTIACALQKSRNENDAWSSLQQTDPNADSMRWVGCARLETTYC